MRKRMRGLMGALELPEEVKVRWAMEMEGPLTVELYREIVDTANEWVKNREARYDIGIIIRRRYYKMMVEINKEGTVVE